MSELQGLTDEKARKILGSGLQQLNREAAGQAMQQLLFAILQNPDSSQDIDKLALIDFWGSLLSMEVDMKKFRITAPPAGTAPGAAGAPAPAIPPTGGANAAPAA